MTQAEIDEEVKRRVATEVHLAAAALTGILSNQELLQDLQGQVARGKPRVDLNEKVANMAAMVAFVTTIILGNNEEAHRDMLQEAETPLSKSGH